ncbi:hypothetical protein BO94DRAFT_591721 [Aspergillus sclerotioniger CBS 115572]|uniref:Uncharacterized protein n=1 Tax=Aspergillus sclerotioniger CBS 115572 TaxID=1450535 RepID=A0A317XC47_9EURO|nr:hypothetical protein BO94DRAFT_591721 [Aspergillus sclerotioniger CBS 115572]PWY96166.1 hypothetical protein BO94DRAFT_591721 [Aspergillus sclerotioniger CBS 115572]
MEPSPLGQLGKLPYEIRLEIYERLFTMKNTPLSIFSSSRAIYKEITDRLYDTLNIHLTPSLKDPWIEVHCQRMRLHWSIHDYCLDCQHRFARVPYHKVNLVVHIYAPDPRDPGQIVLLWQKTDYLVGLLQNATIASLVVRLREDQGHDWQEGGHVVESIPYPNGTRPDHHIVFLPFCCLSNVRELHIVPDTRRMDRVTDWGLVNYGRDFILNNGYRNYNDGPLSQDREYRDIVREFDDIDALVRDTNFFLETRLNDLPGHTAAMLRLARAAHWPPEKMGNTSRVKRCLLDIRQYPRSVALHDPGLKSESFRVEGLTDLYRLSGYRSLRWSWREWCKRYPQGLLPNRDNSTLGAAPWYDWSFEVLSLTGKYYENIRNYQQRNWGTDEPGCRRRCFEQDWCTDCRRIGYQTGCDQDCESLHEIDYVEYWDQDSDNHASEIDYIS